MTIATHTLGCKLNFAETSHLQRQFEKAGFNIVGYHERADIYIINTCTVTAIAEKKCRNAIRQAVALNPTAVVAVIGCFAQNGAEQIAKIPGVSIILGNDQKHRLLEILTEQGFKPSSAPRVETDEPKSFQLSFSGEDRTRTFFKIQDGCDYFCSYCAIPLARGRSRSATIEETVSMARTIAATFHIPLQAGSDKVLRLMRRRYDTALYASRVGHIKSVMPDACIAADVIAGFNGEDDDTFALSKVFIDSLPISYLHVFPYSDRPNTAALRMPERVPVDLRKARSQELHLLSNHKRQAFVESQLGKERTVLWEHSLHTDSTGDTMQGWTDNYIRLHRPFDASLAGKVTPFLVEKSTIVDNFACED